MTFDVYCDESSPENFKHPRAGEYYTLIGSIWCPAEERAGLKARINALRQQHSIHGEGKWGRVSLRALPYYAGLIDLFFDSPLRYRVLVLRADELNLDFHDSSTELMFYKFYYFLLREWLAGAHEYRIFTDIRTNRSRTRLQDLQGFLGRFNPGASVSVQAIPSGESVLMQLTDILTGAVSYRFHRRETSEARLELIRHLEVLIGHRIGPTVKGEQKFNVFRMTPGGDF